MKNILPISKKTHWEKHMDPYRHLYCRKCHLRAWLKKRYLFFNSHTGVVCRGCERASYLIDYVKDIVGLIGKDYPDDYLVQQKVFVHLWDEKGKKGKNADIDLLEIRGGLQTSYDHAINAVLITLKNDVSRPSNYLRRIPVVLKGNPLIPEGSIKVLKSEFGKMRHE